MNSVFICRICLMPSQLSQSHNVFDKTNISDKIFELTKLQITSDDGLPLEICSACNDSLDFSVTFRRQVINADFILREQLLKGVRSCSPELITGDVLPEEENRKESNLIKEEEEEECGLVGKPVDETTCELDKTVEPLAGSAADSSDWQNVPIKENINADMRGLETESIPEESRQQPRTAWVYGLKKAELNEELKKFGLPISGSVKDGRKALASFIKEKHSSQVLQVAGASTTELVQPVSRMIRHHFVTLRKWDFTFDREKDVVLFLERFKELRDAFDIEPYDLLQTFPELTHLNLVCLLKGRALLLDRNSKSPWDTWQGFLENLKINFLPQGYRENGNWK